MKRSTSELIESLVVDSAPVRPLRRPLWRAIGWLLLAALLLLSIAVAHGLRPDLSVKLHERVFLTGVVAAAATGILAAVAAFVASVPGRSLRWLLLPLPALLVWMSTIGYGCLTNWVEISPDGMSPGETARCFATLVLTGVPLSLTLLIMLRHVARLAPVPVAMAGSVAVSAMTAVALSLLHPLDATVMILAWNVGLTAILLIGSAWHGPRLFHWIEPRS
ncbi:NrsF family protein [Burkholderia pyrrocinia]|uniref:NrsF family protein n=1 Tax=Burkholderia pyrrocinia TaxID=60550 RepID=UPI002AB2D3D1|nr:NrsF family protein [Burkholderia pyrrocinia]